MLRNPRLVAGLMLVVAYCGDVAIGRAATWSEAFNGENKTWSFDYDARAVALESHRRVPSPQLEGERYEQIVAFGKVAGTPLQFEHTLPPSRVIDDLKLNLLFRANRPGATVFLRVVFPNQKDPRTGQVLVATVQGTTYTDVGRWQELRCGTPADVMRELIRRQRAELRPLRVDDRGLYVDRVILTAESSPGQIAFGINRMNLEGVVARPETGDIAPASGAEPEEGVDVEFRLDRLVVEGREVFPRIVPYHGEDPELLKRMGVSIVWVLDYRDQELVQRLRRAGLHVMAEPPQPVVAGQVLDDRQVGLVPFGPAEKDILLWYMGTRIPPDAKDGIKSWVRQVRSADRLRNRPLVADVTGLERVYSNNFDMTGLSRHSLNTSFDPIRLKQWYARKRNSASLGGFIWTWVQTEPSAYNTTWRREAGVAPIVTEPEQLRLQVYAALSAGIRGIGFWKSSSLQADDPAARERLLQMTQLNLELGLLEPMLASGSLLEPAEMRVGRLPVQHVGQLGLSRNSSRASRSERHGLLLEREASERRQSLANREMEAAVISSQHGLLVLPVWYQEHSQFCPGQLVAGDVTIKVPRLSETATVWLLTTTGMRGLRANNKVAGGIEVKLPKLDQTAMILVLADPELRHDIQTKIGRIAEQSATVSVELAEVKLERVRAVHEELTRNGVGQSDLPRSITSAELLARRARERLAARDFDTAREAANDCMQQLRILQRAHWDRAVHRLSSVTSSAHAVSFQTLPDHWRMIERIGRGRSRLNDNLLPTGEFEDIEQMIVEGWQYRPAEIEGVTTRADLSPVGREQGMCLQLQAGAEPGTAASNLVASGLVRIWSPPIPVRGGQIVHISGQLELPAPITGNLDGVTIYDTLGGASSALRWHEQQSWQRFEMIREVPTSMDREFRIKIALNGLGRVRIDDLRVVTFDPPLPETANTTESPVPEEEEPDSGRSALDFLPRLPTLSPRRPRE